VPGARYAGSTPGESYTLSPSTGKGCAAVGTLLRLPARNS